MDFQALTDAQREQFNRDGYIIVREALDQKTVQQLVEVGDRLVASNLLIGRQKSETSTDKVDGFRNVITLDDAFIPLLTNPRTVPLIVQLFGPRIHLATSHLIYKYPNMPGTKTSTRCPGWHRDIANTPEDLGHASIPRMEMKCAYYLSDLSEPNSGMTLLSPGSNHLKEPLKINKETGDPENVFEAKLKPGDAVFFENRTWHAGAVNLSKRIRKAVMFGYSFQWLKPMDYAQQPASLMQKVDAIGRQLLGASTDAQGRYIPGGGNGPLIEWCKNHGVTYAPAV
jgi:ectoine hydroxylase-related dioxygenase (phytanoyl-CoA dioxygenase family)